MIRAGSSMRLVRLQPQGPGLDRGADNQVQISVSVCWVLTAAVRCLFKCCRRYRTKFVQLCLMNVSVPCLSWLLKATFLIVSLLLTDLHPPKHVKQNCKPNLIVCSSRWSGNGPCFTLCVCVCACVRACVCVCVCVPWSLHIALFSRHVNCNYLFWHWFFKIIESVCKSLL